jgi:hypothetical protein
MSRAMPTKQTHWTEENDWSIDDTFKDDPLVQTYLNDILKNDPNIIRVASFDWKTKSKLGVGCGIWAKGYGDLPCKLVSQDCLDNFFVITNDNRCLQFLPDEVL